MGVISLKVLLVFWDEDYFQFPYFQLLSDCLYSVWSIMYVLLEVLGSNSELKTHDTTLYFYLVLFLMHTFDFISRLITYKRVFEKETLYKTFYFICF